MGIFRLQWANNRRLSALRQMAALFVSTRILKEKWSKMENWQNLEEKNATQIMTFLPHTQINLRRRKVILLLVILLLK